MSSSKYLLFCSVFNVPPGYFPEQDVNDTAGYTMKNILLKTAEWKECPWSIVLWDLISEKSALAFD